MQALLVFFKVSDFEEVVGVADDCITKNAPRK